MSVFAQGPEVHRHHPAVVAHAEGLERFLERDRRIVGQDVDLAGFRNGRRDNLIRSFYLSMLIGVSVANRRTTEHDLLVG